MANKTTIPNKNIGDFLLANEFNELNNAYNNSVDSIESQIISELYLYDSTLNFSGFVDTSTSTPAHTSGNAYKVVETGTIFGINAEKGQWIIDDGNSFTSHNNNFSGGQTVNITTVNAATYDLLANDYILNITYTSTGAVTSFTLSTAQCVSGRTICIKDAGGNAGTNSITVDTGGAETIDGDNTYTLNINYEYIWLYSDGFNWFIN